jgi:DNA anti-recombination protein RmuC
MFSGGSQGQWLTPEMLTLFLYHQMRPLSLQEELHIIKSLYGRVDQPMQKVVEITHKLRNSDDPTIKNLAASLSTRQLLRIARRMAAFPDDNVFDAIHRACLAR